MKKALTILIMVLFCGCTATTNNQEIEQLKAEIEQRKKEFKILTSQYVDLRNTWEMCNEDLSNTNAQVKDLLQRVIKCEKQHQ